MNDFYYPQVESQLLKKSRALEQTRIFTGQVKEEYDRQARIEAPNLAIPDIPVGVGDIVEAINQLNAKIAQRDEMKNELLEKGFVKEGKVGELVELFDK